MILKNRNIALVSMLIIPLFGFSQIHERGMMKNRTNVEKESSEYTLGIFNDTNQYKKSLIQFGNYDKDDDAAAESEEDILYASFDNTSIHYLQKFNYASLVGNIPIRLTNERQRKYYTCPVEGVLSSHFGPRRNRFHYGTDIAMRMGEPIKAMFDGVVRITRWAGGYGNLIVVRHDNGLETYYGHLSKSLVRDNQKVKAGEVIGLVGSTGRSTGPHLHLEIRYLGAAINPEHMIDFSNYTLKANNEMFYLSRNDFKPTYSRSASVQLAKSTPVKSTRSGRSYTIRKGETLGEIAKRNGTTVKKLCKLNNINGSSIREGQKIKVK